VKTVESQTIVLTGRVKAPTRRATHSARRATPQITLNSISIRRDYARAVARREVTLGISGQAFARMVDDSPVLQTRLREILDQRERALADAIVAEAGTEDALARVVAAELASVHRVLYAEASRRSLAGESREEIQAVLAATADRAFDLLEPSLGSYGVREAD
jgi:CRP-like cAMP-binding protein